LAQAEIAMLVLRAATALLARSKRLAAHVAGPPIWLRVESEDVVVDGTIDHDETPARPTSLRWSFLRLDGPVLPGKGVHPTVARRATLMDSFAWGAWVI
jgi:hypothetical protein